MIYKQKKAYDAYDSHTPFACETTYDAERDLREKTHSKLYFTLCIARERLQKAYDMSYGHTPFLGGGLMIIKRCGTCNLTYDEPAYQAHLAHPCDYGIRPMLACDVHDIDCPYNNPVRRYQTGATWTDKDRPCRPLYQMKSHPQEGIYLSLYEAPRSQRSIAPRLPKKLERAESKEEKESQ